MASTIIDETFVDICASLGSHAVSLVTGITRAIPRSRRVGARGIRVASPVVSQTLIDVHASRLPHAISLVSGVTQTIAGSLMED